MDTRPVRDQSSAKNLHPAQPTLCEMEIVVAHASRCLVCAAAAATNVCPCYEFTPGGVEVCADLPWWQGKPILPETLREWKEIVTSYQAVPHRADD